MLRTSFTKKCRFYGLLGSITAHAGAIILFFALITEARTLELPAAVESAQVALTVVPTRQNLPKQEQQEAKPVPEQAVPEEKPALQKIKEPNKTDPKPKKEKTKKKQPEADNKQAARQEQTQSSNTPANAEAENKLLQQAQAKQTTLSYLIAQLEKYKKYPTAARKLGLEGVVNIRVSIDSNGNLASIIAESTSLHPLLQKSVEETVNKVKENWKAQGQAQSISLVIPFRYKIVDR